MTLDLDKIKAKLMRSQTGKGGGEGKKDFLRLELDKEVTVRIVPVNDGKNDPFKDFFMHYNVGNSAGFLCPKKVFSDDCPVCDFASSLWAESNEEDVDDRTMAKRLFAGKRFYSPVIVRGEEDKGVRWWSYSKVVYEELLKLCLSEDYGDITDIKSGTDLLLKCEKPKGKLYQQTSITPRRMPSPLSEDQNQASDWINNATDILELLVRKSTDEVQQMLDEFLLAGVSPENVSKEETKYSKSDSDGAEKKGKKGKPKSEVDKAFDEVLSDDD